MLKITHNDVKMTEKRKQMFAAAKFYAKKLRLNSYAGEIIISFKFDYYKTFNIYALCDYAKTGLVVIDIDANLFTHCMLSVLAHEMVHAKQYLTGQLTHSRKGNFVWKGKEYTNEKYIKCPWELEAMRKQMVLNYQYMETLK